MASRMACRRRDALDAATARGGGDAPIRHRRDRAPTRSQSSISTPPRASPAGLRDGGGGSGQPNAATGADAATHEVLVRDTGTGEVKSSAYTDVCFLPGTKITLFDKIRINIENLQKGDSLLSYKLEDMDPLYKSVDVLSWFSEDDTGEFIDEDGGNM